MSTFHLPDLGEGLAEGEIREWFVKEGDAIQVDQPLVAIETAKAVVDVPSPQTGTVLKLHAEVGDTVPTGAALVEFKDSSEQTEKKSNTVAGELPESNQILVEEAIRVTITTHSESHALHVPPAVRALAKKLNVNLSTVKGTGPAARITREDVQRAADQSTADQTALSFQPLRGARKAMAQHLHQAHADIASVTLFDDANVHHWPEDADCSIKLMQALVHAVEQEPHLNAWYDHHPPAIHCHEQIHLGIAVDTRENLFVPVISDLASRSGAELREQLNMLKRKALAAAFTPEELSGATLVLSNFGSLGGRYATPMVVPPCVAILGVGRFYTRAVEVDGQLQMQRFLPLSLSFDHRAVTGGESARFLQVLIQYLEQNSLS